MPNSQVEYEALANLAKSDRKFRVVSYALILLVAITAIVLLAVGQHQQQKSANKTLDQITTVNQETIHYMTCLFVIPIANRTPAAQRACFKQADLPGGLNANDFVTVPPEAPSKSVPSSSVSNPSAPSSSSNNKSSTPNTTPSGSSSQPNNVQPDKPAAQPDPRRVLGVPVCLPFTQMCVRQ